MSSHAEQVRILHGKLMIVDEECDWQIDEHRLRPQTGTGFG
jgi:hypothetical protein